MSKRARELTTAATAAPTSSAFEKNGGPLDEEAAEMKRQADLEERRRQSTLLAGEAIKRELAGKEKEEQFPDVDDTDGLDPEGEFEAWKLRELMRVKRDREAETLRSREREEVEARRALPEALRLKEDTERAAALRAAKTAQKAAGGGPNFLQKYHHKGAFYADDEVLQRYDYSAPTEGEVHRDMSSLPKVMQVRNFGKMSRTKYTHLKDQDTSDRNAGWSAGSLGGGKQGANLLGQGCFHCGGNHVCLHVRRQGSRADVNDLACLDKGSVPRIARWRGTSWSIGSQCLSNRPSSTSLVQIPISTAVCSQRFASSFCVKQRRRWQIVSQ